jgi:hypothetical protein
MLSKQITTLKFVLTTSCHLRRRRIWTANQSFSTKNSMKMTSSRWKPWPMSLSWEHLLLNKASRLEVSIRLLGVAKMEASLVLSISSTIISLDLSMDSRGQILFTGHWLDQTSNCLSSQKASVRATCVKAKWVLVWKLRLDKAICNRFTLALISHSDHWLSTAEGLPTPTSPIFQAQSTRSNSSRSGWEETYPWRVNRAQIGTQLCPSTRLGRLFNTKAALRLQKTTTTTWQGKT